MDRIYPQSCTKPLIFPQITDIKETFTWDYKEKAPYNSDPLNYHVEVLASANFVWDENALINDSPPLSGGYVRDTSNHSINNDFKILIDDSAVTNNTFTFLSKDVLKQFNLKFSQQNTFVALESNGFDVYIRTASNDGSRYSCWKVYNIDNKGNVSQINKKIDRYGNESTLDPDDLDVGNNGGSDSAPYSPDSSTTANSNPNSGFYDGSSGANSSTFIANIRSAVNSLVSLPSIMTVLFSWMPEYLITLMVTSIGLMVIVGIVKWVL